MVTICFDERGPGEEELYDLYDPYLSPTIVQVIKSRKMG
jgi:hypothetical protein